MDGGFAHTSGARAQARRVFLFLQGPHGPFFDDLAKALRAAGHGALHIGFNAGDAHYWSHAADYTGYTAPMAAFADYLSAFIEEYGVSDLVLYGDTKPHHEQAKAVAQAAGLRVHCFEEGYIRPYWITYERDGSNGHSVLMGLSLETILARAGPAHETAAAPGHWGALWHHTWYGCIYHGFILFLNQRYPHFKTHRAQSVWREWLLHCKRLALIPARAMDRWRRTRRLKQGGMPYFVFLLQLAHDASIRHHAKGRSPESVIADVIKSFAAAAPAHYRLVFKAHPLEDGRMPVQAFISEQAAACGVSDRVDFLTGGKLGALLDSAKAALTINSTAGQQVLYRGLPLKVFGTSVYDRPEFVSPQSLSAFLREPQKPDLETYRAYRRFLLDTSQIRGGFYTKPARKIAVRGVLDKMLSARDPYHTDQSLRRNCATKPMVVCV